MLRCFIVVVRFPTNVIEPWQLLPKVNRDELPRKAKALGQKRKVVAGARVDVLVDCWSESCVRLTLGVFAIELFRVQFEIDKNLTFKVSRGLTGDSSAAILNALWDPTGSKVIHGKEERELDDQDKAIVSVHEYISLNPFCLVTDFYVHPIERGSGVGRAWYLGIVEPFLRQSGIKVVVGKGSCLEAEADEFWKKMGFARIIPYDYEYDTDILHSFRFKVLN